MRHSVRLVLAVLALALVTTAPALPQVHRTAPARPASLTDTLRGFLADIFKMGMGDLGCGIDPYGACHSAATIRPAATPNQSLYGDLGCEIDPFGRCTQSASPTNGGH